jgi:hypothetical protein
MKYGKSDKGYFIPKGQGAEQMQSQGNAMGQNTAGQGKGPGDDLLMQVWNGYVDWLEQKGLKGDPSLDKGGRGYQMLEQYNKEMKQKDPAFLPIQQGDVSRVQELLKDYRTFSMNEIRNDKSMVKFGDGQTLKYSQMDENRRKEFEDVWMQNITKTPVDGNPGQFTTSMKFPSAFIQTLSAEGEKIGERRRLGYGPSVQMGDNKQ